MTAGEKLKAGKAGAKRRLAAAVQGSQLTLSGELLIERQGMHSIEISEVENLGVMEETARLAVLFPGLEVKTLSGLCDVTIKLFLHEGTIYQADFYATLQDALTRCAEKIYAKPEYTLRLNVIGELRGLGEAESFRFLNKDALVSHKIVAKQQHFCPFKGIRDKLAKKIMK